MSATVLQRDVAVSRLRQLPPLLRPLLGAVRWQPSVGTAGLAGLLLLWTAEDLDDGGTAVLVLRGVAALLALGAAFLLDDAAADTIAASPTSLAWRRSSRLLVAAALVGIPWATAVLTVAGRGADLPVGDLSLEFAALLALALAAAAGLARWADAREPGLLAVPFIAGLLLATFRLPERWALIVPPGPAWEAAHERWLLLLAAALLVQLACNRDPARSSLW